ncbi:MAG: 3D domain-containing protein [Endomicrobia bacterium]|nr:3D domain-containing protein [Endomicrobiia bacterium]
MKMNKKVELKKIIQLVSVALGILILSSVFSSINLSRVNAYIESDGVIIAVMPYKNIPLKNILEKNAVSLEENDIVTKDINKPLKPSQTAKIIRVTKEKKHINENAPFRITWSRKYNSNLRKVELQKGIEKNTSKNVWDTYHDGLLHHRETLNERSATKEYYRLVLLTKDNKPEKIYDLSKMKSKKMVATAYYPGDPLAWGDGTVTFLGQKMQRGIIAVDPKVIPLKTRLFVSGYGYGYAGDTGNLIKGNRVDLGVNNAYEELSWTFRDVTVYILEPSETW